MKKILLLIFCLLFYSLAFAGLKGGFYDPDTDLSNIPKNLVPLADDTYDIGSSAKKWQDLYLSGDITVNGGDITSSAALNIKPTGDTDDYLTLSTVSNIPTIYGTGAYTRFGDASATANSLDSEDDVLVTGELECGSNLYSGLSQFAQDAGLVDAFDMPVSDVPADNTVEGYNLKVDGNAIMTIYSQADSAGAVDTKRVGINTITPATTLHVIDDNADANHDLVTFDRTTSSPADADSYDIIFNHENDNNQQEDFAQMTVIASDVSDGTEGGALAFSTADGVDGSMDERVRIIANGNVGIGVTNPSQELDLVGDLELEETTSNDTGVIYKGSGYFIHNFHHPTGGGAVPSGENIFIGINAGNFTMGSTATQTYQASYNVGVGASVLIANTIGGSNTGVGRTALFSNTTGEGNVVVGRGGLYSNTTGNYNTALGLDAGKYIADGVTPNLTSDYSFYFGKDTKALADNDQNEIVLGYNCTGLGSNTAVLGNSSIVTTGLRGNVGIGTTAPEGLIEVQGAEATDSKIYIDADDGDDNADTYIIASVAADNTMTITNHTTVLSTLSSAGAYKWNTYGAGALTTDASGNITAVSDQRLKDIKGSFTRGLTAIKNIKPVLYKWNEKSGLETEHTYAGFIAQEIKKVIPEAVGQGKDGYYTLSDRPIIAALVNAVKEQQVMIDRQGKEIDNLKKIINIKK